MAKRQPGSTFTKKGQLYRVSSTGRPFKSSNSAKANQQRALNARLDQPAAIIPGTNLTSQLTERDLAHQAGAATTVRYGPQEQSIAEQLAQAVQQKNDTQAWYDDYKNRLQSYQQQVGAYQLGAQQAMQALQGGVTGLGQQDQSFVQGQQAQMPQGTAPVSPGIAQNANAALAVRQGIAGNYGVNQANIGAANNTYASNLANVVGPQQQLTALATKQGGINKVLKQKTALKGEEGAYNQQYRSEKRSDETKNLLAAGALGINQQNAQTNAARAAATAQQNSPEGKAASAQVTNEARVAANHGYSLHDWRMLGPTKRSAVIAKDKKSSSGRVDDKVYTSGPFAGKTQAEIQAMTPAQRDALINKKNKTTGPTLTTEQQNTGMTQVVTLGDLAAKAHGGHPFDAGHGKQKPLTRAQAVQKIRGYKGVGGKIADNSLLSAALDAVYVGHISPATAQSLKDAGFDPARVARSLHVPLGRPGANIPLNKK
jgi:hypothetical protein